MCPGSATGCGALKKLAEYPRTRFEQRNTAMAGEVEGARPHSRMIDKGIGQSSAAKSECDGQASNRICALTNNVADVRTGIASWNSTERQIYPHKVGPCPP